jgi:hypothetical protein
LAQAFFGLTHDDIEEVLLEPWFLLQYYVGMDTATYYNLPITYKRWLIERVIKEINKASEQKADIPSKGAHHNDPQIRAMAGKFKNFGSYSKNQRFT